MNRAGRGGAWGGAAAGGVSWLTTDIAVLLLTLAGAYCRSMILSENRCPFFGIMIVPSEVRSLPQGLLRCNSNAQDAGWFQAFTFTAARLWPFTAADSGEERRYRDRAAMRNRATGRAGAIGEDQGPCRSAAKVSSSRSSSA